MKVCVTGGRASTEVALIYDSLDAVHRATPITALAHGGAGKIGPITGRLRGADLIAGAWAETRGIEVVSFPVTEDDWLAYGRGAGPRRNRIMLNSFKPELLVAFPGGAGTADCIRAATTLGIEVRRFPEA